MDSDVRPAKVKPRTGVRRCSPETSSELELYSRGRGQDLDRRPTIPPNIQHGLHLDRRRKSQGNMNEMQLTQKGSSATVWQIERQQEPEIPSDSTTPQEGGSVFPVVSSVHHFPGFTQNEVSRFPLWLQSWFFQQILPKQDIFSI